MSEMIHQWNIQTVVDIDKYDKPVNAPMPMIIQALNLLTEREFRLWVGLCGYGSILQPDWLKARLNEYEDA